MSNKRRKRPQDYQVRSVERALQILSALSYTRPELSLQAISTTAVARSVPDVLDRFARSRLVIPMRLHALVLAQLAGAPCAALSYDPKVAAAAAMAAVPCHELSDLPATEVIAACWQQQIGHLPDPEGLARIRRDAAVHQATLNAVWSIDGSGPCAANS